MKRLRSIWQSLFGEPDRRVRLARILGFLFVVAGFAVIAKAWDGAANQFRVDSQVPYLLSGGFMGLGLIVTGAMLLLLATVRVERKLLTDRYEDMTRLLGRNLSRLEISSNGSGQGEQVVAGGSAYHRPGCKILQGKESLARLTVEQAVGEGLTPCRVCNPPVPEGAEA
ncbi:MAG: hypothetical protein ABR505_05355 [Actinomycetota bacterium]